MSEPALSKYIKRMEENLGQPLLERHPSGCTLTKAGELVANKGLSIIKMRDKLLNEIRDLPKQKEKILRFGLANCYSETLLSQFLPYFVQEHPEVKVSLIINKTDVLESMCINGDIDIILTQEEYCDPRLDTTAICKEDIVIFLPETYHAHPDLSSYIQKGSIPLKSLKNYPCAEGNGHERFNRLVKQYYKEGGFQPNPIFKSESWSTILSLIPSNQYYCIMPDIFKTPSEGTIKLNIESQYRTHRTLSFGYQPRKTLPGIWQDFIDTARKNIK